MEAELSLARARLAASVEALRREVEHLRRMEESLSECERLRNMLAPMDVVRAHLADSRMSEIIELVRNSVEGDSGALDG